MPKYEQLGRELDISNLGKLNGNFIDIESDIKDVNTKADSVQTQVDQLVVDGDSSVEAAQARVDENGISKPTLKQRIDDGFIEVHKELSASPYYDEITFTKNFDTASGTTYYITKIPNKDTDGNLIKLKHGFANDNFNGGMPETPRSFANRHQTSLCINASTFDTATYQLRGVQIQDGVILQAENVNNINNRWALGIKADNTLVAYDQTKTTAKQMLADGCVDAFTGFYPIIQDGKAVDAGLYSNDKTCTSPNPRQAIGQMPNGDIVILTCDGRTADDIGMTFDDLIRIFLSLGVKFAYNFDGGGSSSTVMRGFMINKPIDDGGLTERKVSDFLYVQKPSKYPYKLRSTNVDIGIINKNISDLAVALYNHRDFNAGSIRLRGPEGFLYDGIEAWTGDTKNTKLTLSPQYLKYYDYVNEKTIFNVDESGDITTTKGTIGNFFSSLKAIPDFNKVDATGIYWGIGNGTTANMPTSDVSWGMIHWQIGTAGAMQVAFPYHNSAYKTKQRRTDTKQPSGWSPWRDL